jgi:hypothetical protein
MLTNSARWRALETEFRTLCGPIRLIATLDGHWFFSCDWSDGACPSPYVKPDQAKSDHLQTRFEALAMRAGIAAGAMNHEQARDSWLNLVRDQGLYVRLFHGTRDGVPYRGKRIDDVVLASAEYCHVCKNRALELELGISPRSSDRGVLGARPSSDFWRDRQAEFGRYAIEYSDLIAKWDAPGGGWWLHYGDKVEVPQQCKDLFEAVARSAISGFQDVRSLIAARPGPRVGPEAEPWCLWLDFMRLRNWGFRVTGHTPCTEREWDAGVRDGTPLLAIRRQQKHTGSEEWKKVYRRTATGKLRRLSARDLKGKTSEDLRKYYHWLENGAIEHVFQSSARFCEALAAEAFELEAATKHGQTSDLRVNAELTVLSDFQDLPESDRDLMTAAELQAESALEAGQRDQSWLVNEAYDLGVDFSDIGFSPGSTLLELANDKDTQLRGQVAAELFKFGALLHWRLLKPDVTAFIGKLDRIWKWACQRVQLNTEIPHSVKRDWQAWALTERARVARPDAADITLKPDSAGVAEPLGVMIPAEQLSPATGANTGNSTGQPEANTETSSEAPEPAPGLRTDLIEDWIDDKGYTNKLLAERLRTSVRVISSLRNNGKYHGRDAVTRLANLMGCDPTDLYLP